MTGRQGLILFFFPVISKFHLIFGFPVPPNPVLFDNLLILGILFRIQDFLYFSIRLNPNLGKPFPGSL